MVYDGGSKDGTKEFLQQLYDNGKIQFFKSEKDTGESHGTNRAMLACKGEILKVLTDDDIYCYEAIRECKNYMLLNKELDMIGADGYDNHNNLDLQFMSHQKFYLNWVNKKEPFAFYGPGFFIRKSSIPLIGLFNCTVKFIDTDF